MKYDVDLFTIGAGSGGVRASRMAARRGKRVAVAEARFLGGTCVNVGCVPKKLLVYASAFRGEFAQAAGFGWTVPETPFNWTTLIANKDREIARLNEVYARLLHGAGVEILRGRARIVDPHTVEVIDHEGAARTLTCEHILVATGGSATRPDQPGTEAAWISDDVFSLPVLPERLMVVGGGYIALEMASIFNGLGVKVSLVHRGAKLLKGFDEDVRTVVLEELRKKGVDVHLNTKVTCLERAADGSLSAMLSHDECLPIDAALYAIGRRPNTHGLGLEAVGVALNAGGAVIVDDRFQTNVPSIFAIGDVTDRLNLTPVAIAEAMALVDLLYADRARPVRYDSVPTAVFSQPPVATVGLSEAAAAARYEKLHIYTSEFRPMKNTLGGSTEHTFMKIVVDAASDLVLGVHIVGADGPEIIQGFAVAMLAGAKKADFDATIGLHPTAAEELVTMRERRADPS